MEGIANPAVVPPGMIGHVSELRVRYADTDQMKQVYYGKYFEYFEQGRSDFLRALGLPYSELERQGFLLPVIEAHANYVRPAQYDDVLHVRTMLAELPTVRIRLDYSIVRGSDHALLAEGHTLHTFIHAETRKPTRAPETFLRVIRDAFEQQKKLQC